MGVDVICAVANVVHLVSNVVGAPISQPQSGAAVPGMIEPQLPQSKPRKNFKKKKKGKRKEIEERKTL